MKARKNAAVFGFSASTSTPSRNARLSPTGSLSSESARPALRKVLDAEPDQIERADEFHDGEQLPHWQG